MIKFTTPEDRIVCCPSLNGTVYGTVNGTANENYKPLILIYKIIYRRMSGLISHPSIVIYAYELATNKLFNLTIPSLLF